MTFDNQNLYIIYCYIEAIDWTADNSRLDKLLDNELEPNGYSYQYYQELSSNIPEYQQVGLVFRVSDKSLIMSKRRLDRLFAGYGLIFAQARWADDIWNSEDPDDFDTEL